MSDSTKFVKLFPYKIPESLERLEIGLMQAEKKAAG